MLDHVIKGGTIVDGTGAPGVRGDVGVRDGRIVQVGGTITEAAANTIDADGAIVTPGWVDVHTHYDGQVSWDEEMDPSAGNGVTTIVMGNCGVGFAPVRPGGEKSLIELMEGVEDIPGTALYEGIEWGRWETLPRLHGLHRGPAVLARHRRADRARRAALLRDGRARRRQRGRHRRRPGRDGSPRAGGDRGRRGGLQHVAHHRSPVAVGLARAGHVRSRAGAASRSPRRCGPPARACSR